MLQSITMKNVASYDHNGILIEGLKKVNFVYGSNGSGKTTITKFVANEKSPLFGDCILKWRGDLPVRALVYNKEFRERNFGKESIPGVFTLGEATKDDIAAIQEMELKLAQIKECGIKRKEALDKLQQKRSDLETQFREEVWTNVYKEYEHIFKEAFIGVQRKEAFKEKLLEQHKSNTSTLYGYEKLLTNAETIFGEPPQPMTQIPILDFQRLSEIEEDSIWKKKILGKEDVEIGRLIQKLNLNDWVNEGRQFLDDDRCPFCQEKTITDNFRQQLEAYFDETFTKDTTTVKSSAEEYVAQTQIILNILLQVENNERENIETKINIDIFSAYLKTVSSQLQSNKELLHNKLKEPSRPFELISTQELMEEILQLLTDANKKIDAHNKIVVNLAESRRQLIVAVWRYLVEEVKGDIDKYLKAFNDLTKGIDGLEQQRLKLLDDHAILVNSIRDANKTITSVQSSVDEINGLLRSFGFTGFEIVPSIKNKNQYEIKREDGSLAEPTLSEGEITFITFLYFLQLTKGSTTEETISEERILVIDDPISSLDSTILFVVSTLLKQLIKQVKCNQSNVKQVIILTHNVYFHKEVSFIDGRNDGNKDTHFWILRKSNKSSCIQAYETKNPIKNSYELLWQELRNYQHSSGVTMQNTMRRIIENYFKILGNYNDDTIIDGFQKLEEKEICRALLCWINDGSHCLPDDLFVEQQDTTITKYLLVFREIFNLTGHLQHYNMMMGESAPGYAEVSAGQNGSTAEISLILENKSSKLQ